MHKAPGQSEVADLMRMQRCNEFEIALEQACTMGLGKLQQEFSQNVDYPSKQKVTRDFRKFYRAELRRLTLLTAEQLKTTSNIAELKRNNIILTTIDSSRQVTTILNCKSGFSVTGLFPRSVDKAIKYRYVIDDSDAPIHPKGRKTKKQNNKWTKYWIIN
ncbi:MAG: hypothetical protein EZS28_006017 [Streblomastix strix]|uniref:Uncharacterized protein n=1 Tax=Streblomastix strix TaxID=222440 RepID=A0A5J4WTU5_9EUKA|nr:MAG: hypothetical protein EZS28_006017 [Streblomastix strix]